MGSLSETERNKALGTVWASCLGAEIRDNPTGLLARVLTLQRL